MQHDAGILADRIEHDGLFEFGDDLAHDLDGLSFQTFRGVSEARFALRRRATPEHSFQNIPHADETRFFCPHVPAKVQRSLSGTATKITYFGEIQPTKAP